jgi:hypothetical protein
MSFANFIPTKHFIIFLWFQQTQGLIVIEVEEEAQDTRNAPIMLIE